MATPLGEKIRRERKRLKLTLDQLAEKIGASKSYVWELENRPVVRPSAEKMTKLAEVFGAPVEFLLDDSRSELQPSDREQQFFRKFSGLSDDKKRQLEQILEVLDQQPNPKDT